jgi:hypothetical protein
MSWTIEESPVGLTGTGTRFSAGLDLGEHVPSEDVLAGLPMPEHGRRPAAARQKHPAAAQAAHGDWIRPARRDPDSTSQAADR